MQTQINELLQLRKERQVIGEKLSQNVKKLSKLKHLESSDYLYFIKKIKQYDAFVADYGFYREHKTYVHKVTGQRIRLNTIISDSGILSLFEKYNTKNPKHSTYHIYKYGYENIPNYVFNYFNEKEDEFNEYLRLDSERKELNENVSKLDKKNKKLQKYIKSEIESDFLERFNNVKLLDDGFNIEQLLSFLNSLKESLSDYEIVFSTKNFFQTNDFFNKKSFKLIDKESKEELSFEHSIYLIFKNTKDLDIQYTLYDKYKNYIIDHEFKKLISFNEKGA